MKTTTIAALFVASVLLIGVAGATSPASPAYAGIGTSPGPLSFWDMFSMVIQGSGWGWL